DQLQPYAVGVGEREHPAAQPFGRALGADARLTQAVRPPAERAGRDGEGGGADLAGSGAAARRARPHEERHGRPGPAQLVAGVVEAHAAVMDGLGRELMDRRGMSLTWYGALLQLSGAPGCRLRMSELADSIVISRSGFSRAARRMEEAGLIAREPSPEDGRGA